MRSNLEKLVLKNHHIKGKGKLTKNTRVELVNAVRCAIIIRSKEKDQRNTAKKLQYDINSINHIYGDHHTRC